MPSIQISYYIHMRIKIYQKYKVKSKKYLAKGTSFRTTDIYFSRISIESDD